MKIAKNVPVYRIIRPKSQLTTSEQIDLIKRSIGLVDAKDMYASN
jgi:biotin synthase-like enzyme